MKAQYRAIETKVMKWAGVWHRRMGLSHIEIEHVFLDSYFGDDGEEDFKVSAVTESRWEYDEAKIKWYLPSVIRHDDVHLEQVLVHELCHVMLAPEQAIINEIRNSDIPHGDAIADIYAKHIEMSTERASRALWNACGTAG